MAAVALGAVAFPAEATGDATARTPWIPIETCLGVDSGGSSEEPAPPPAPPVLVEGLGTAGLEPDSANPEARAWFAQGVQLIWAFDEAEAIRAFREAQRLDPSCALCFFGEAWARAPTINLQPRTEELAAARAAADRADDLARRPGKRDRALIRGMRILTRGRGGFRDEEFARFMEEAAERLPEDDTIAVMAASARMVTWSARRMPEGTLSQTLLERVLARSPDHDGAIHFYIHLTDWIDRQALAVPYAERLGRLAPAASHLVHMPSHTFYGVGRYGDAAAVNVAAMAADRAFLERVRPPRTDYRYFLNAHNMHFAIESALARGDGVTALDVSRQFTRDYLAGESASRARVLGSAAWYSRGLHAPIGEVLAMAEPEHALDKAFYHYARGEALARRGDAAAVRAEAAAIGALRDGVDAPALGASGSALAEVGQFVLEGRAAMLAGDPRAAEAAYRRAMTRQLGAGFGSDPPLFWYPVRRSLAAALIAAGRPGEAREQLEASLRRWPDDPLSLYVLSRAERALGNAEAADRALGRARAAWAGDPADLPPARL